MKKILLGTYKCTLSDSDVTEDFMVVTVDLKSISDAEVLVWNNEYPFGNQELSMFPKLNLFLNWGTNDSNIKIKQTLLKKKIEIKYIDYYATQTLVEYTLSLMLLYERSLLQIAAGEKIIGREIYGKRVGIIGLGKIGYRVGEVLSTSFKCSVSYFSSSDKQLLNFRYKNLKKLLSESDYLIITVKDDNFILKMAELRNANKDLLIINVTNENVLPTKTAETALERKYIRGYVADLRTIHHNHNSKPGSILVPKAGYLTDQSKANKRHILQLMLKKYAAKVLKKTNTIYVLRHGGTEWNSKKLYQGTLDSTLTAEGEQHAIDIAHYVRGKGVSKIFVSPLGRAQSSALIISKITQIPIITIPELREVDFGILQGHNKDEMMELFSKYFNERRGNKYIKLYRPYPGGESYYDAYLRVLGPVLKLIATEDNFIILGHEGINRIIRGIINEKNPEETVYYKQKNNEIISINFSSGNEHIDVI